jgi:raffinose/stachyose/melibiose transport system permease protein
MVPAVVELKYFGLSNNLLGTSFIYVAVTLPFSVFLYTGYMRSLPKELYEAARIDGCSFFQSYLYVYMPLLKTITGTVIILQGVGFWNDFLISYVTLCSAESMPLIPRLFAFSSGRLTRYDLLFSGTFLISLPIVIIFIAFQRVFVEGITAGAVKG